MPTGTGVGLWLNAVRRRLTRSFKVAVTLGLLSGLLSVVAATVVSVTPAAAAASVSCIDPAGASTTTVTTTFVDAQASTYNVECEEATGVSGSSAYPASIALTSGTLPTNGTFAGSNQSTCSTSSGGTTTTSGSGTTEEYILVCAVADTSPASYSTAAPLQFTATPASGSGLSTVVSATLNVTFVAPTAPTCIDPATAGTSATFSEGVADFYTVECYSKTGVSGLVSYPSSMSIASGSFPSSTPHLSGGTSTGTEPGTAGTGTGTVSTTACGTTTSGSGTTEEYILECDFVDTSVPADTAGNPNAFTFNATNTSGVTSGNGTAAQNSGNLNVTVAPGTVACIDPASGGSSTTFYEGGTNSQDSYNVECEEASGISGVTAYPSSISINSGALPVDANQEFAGSSQSTCSTSAGGTTTTSGSGTTEDYILVCALSGAPQSDDTGSYGFNFTATGPGGYASSAVSGSLTVNVSGPSSACLDPSGSGTTTTFTDGTAGSYTVECYSQGFPSASSGNYPAVNIASGSLPSSGDIKFGGAVQSTCAVGSGGTTTTSGSGFTEEYITECTVAGTPTSADNPSPSAGTYPFTFSTTPGANGGTSATSGTLTLKIVGTAPTSHTGQFFNAIPGVPFCFDFIADTVTTANGGLPLTNITFGSVTTDITNPTVQNLNLAAGSAQLCGTVSSALEGSDELLAPVVTNQWGSATGSIGFSSYAECNWTTSTGNGEQTSLFDSNQDTYQTGSQSAFGQPITGGVTDHTANREEGTIAAVKLTSSSNQATTTTAVASSLVSDVITGTGIPVGTTITAQSTNAGTTTFTMSANASAAETSDTVQIYYNTMYWPTCTKTGLAGGAADAFFYVVGSFTGGSPTVNTSNSIPAPKDVNNNSGLNSVDLDLGTDTAETYPTPPTGGCYGTAVVVIIGPSAEYSSFGTTAELDMPSPWVNGGQCAYGSLGSNSGPADTDSFATCPPTQADVDEGYVDCTTIASSGNDSSGTNTSFNYSSDDLFFSGQPVPQTSTVSLSSSTVDAGDTVTITGGSNWWGAGGENEPNTACVASTTGLTTSACTSSGGATYGDSQVGDYYPLGAPQVYIASASDPNASADAHAAGPITSNVALYGSTYVCTGTGSNNSGTVNPCTFTVGGNNPGSPAPIGGTFNVPQSLAAGTYNVYIDAGNATALPGNGPADASIYPASPNGTTNPSIALGTDEAVTQITIGGATLIKTSTTSGYGSAGQTLNYDYAITNTNTHDTLSNIAVSDNLIPSGNISCPSTTLAGGASETCTGTYTTTQADVDRGYVTNTATVVGTLPSSDTVTSSPSSATVYANEATSSLALVKSTSSLGYGAAGNTIPYSYAVTNNGTTTISNISVSDNLVSGVSCPNSSLAPGASETCTGSYTVAQADVDAGSVTNIATASGTNPSSVTVTSPSSTVTVEASNATSSLSLDKTTTSNGYGAAGQTLNYNYAVTNTGTTTESDITVADNLVTSVTCPDATLAPGASETCTGSYVVAQSDVDAGSVTNNAQASATNPYSATVESNTSTVTVEASAATSSLSLDKTSLTSGYGAVGNTINYDYAVQNTGTTTISSISVTDNLVPDVDCPDSSLAPGASETCTGSYTVTQADVDAGSVTNESTATGQDPQSDTIDSNESSVDVPASSSSSALTLTKSSLTSGYGAAGDVIDYSYAVENTGTTTLTGISVSDDLVSSVTCPDATLSPGASETCTGSYTVTQADVDAGSVTNTATASGTTEVDGTVTSNESQITVPASGETSSLTLAKSSTTPYYSGSGDVISYNYLVQNTGTTTLSGISVSDDLIADVSCPDATLAPGASETCTGTYTTVRADVESGSVTNTATASGTDSSDNTVESTQSSVTVTSTFTHTFTDPTSSTGALGGSNTDEARVTGNDVAGNPTGSVTFYECGPTAEPTSCSSATGTKVGSAESLSSVAGSPDQSEATSAPFTASSTGYWCFAAYYSGGTSPEYSASSETAVHECYDITSASTTTQTSVSPGTITLGQSESDSATVTGNSAGGSPTGTVDFYVCGPTQSETPCTAQSDQVGTSAALTTGANDESSANSTASFTPDAPGYWCFGGYYSSDTNYTTSSDTGVDECFLVNEADATTTTTPSSTSITLGGSVTDTATVTGNSSGGAPTGSVTFYECGPTGTAQDCTSTANQVGSSAVDLGSPSGNSQSATSDSFTPTSTGYWCFGGVYSGDSNYNGSSDTSSTDECVDVTEAGSTTVTTPSSTSVVLGSSISDTANVTGNAAGGAPTGSVTFYECGPTGSAATCTSQAHEVGSGAVNLSNPEGDSAESTSVSITPDAVGYWCFAGYYGGDSNYSSSSDTSLTECVDVTQATSTTVTTPTSSITLGQSGHDSATVTGNSAGGAPTGSVTFYVCGPTANAQPCTSLSHEVGSSAVALGNPSGDSSSAVSVSFTPSSAGTWCFAGYYSGDSNYSSSSDSSVDECVNVEEAASQTTTSPTSSSITLGQSNTDSATVTGNSAGGAPTGSVTFYVCGPTASAQGCTAVTNEVGSNAVTLGNPTGDSATAKSVSFTPPSGGYWCFAAYYSGNSNYSSSNDLLSSECFDVTVPKPTITSFTPASGPVGKVVTLKGTNLAGATKVTLDGKKATVSSDTATQIKFKVPTGAKTGKIVVTTPGGSVTSKTKFKVT